MKKDNKKNIPWNKGIKMWAEKDHPKTTDSYAGKSIKQLTETK